MNSLFQEGSIWAEVESELKAAKKKHPHWPTHVVARAAIVTEESGELMQAALEFKYEKGIKGRSPEEQKALMRKEVIHTAATAIRFLESLK